MTLPDEGDEPSLYRDEPEWGVSRDPERPERSPRYRSGQAPVNRLIWIVLTILIILSLVLPWILPYLFPRRVPLRDGLQASQRFSESAILANSPIR